MKMMEERMREIELSLHNVKLLLKEKVVQLKEQVSLISSVMKGSQHGSTAAPSSNNLRFSGMTFRIYSC